MQDKNKNPWLYTAKRCHELPIPLVDQNRIDQGFLTFQNVRSSPKPISSFFEWFAKAIRVRDSESANNSQPPTELCATEDFFGNLAYLMTSASELTSTKLLGITLREPFEHTVEVLELLTRWVFSFDQQNLFNEVFFVSEKDLRRFSAVYSIRACN
jgi:hypothetical protein